MKKASARFCLLDVTQAHLLSCYVQRPREAERHQAEILQKCAGLFDEGKLRIELADTLPLAEATEAHRRIEGGGMQGKLVLRID